MNAIFYNSFYDNLQTLYNLLNYEPNHILNLEKFRIRVGKQVKTRVLTIRGSHMVYNNIPKSQEWLIVNCEIKATWSILPRFYIFKEKILRNNYIKFCKSCTCMTMQIKAWMTSFLLKKFFLTLQQVCSRWHFTI